MANKQHVFLTVFLFDFIEEIIDSLCDIKIAFPVWVAMDEFPSLGKAAFLGPRYAFIVAIGHLDEPRLNTGGNISPFQDYLRGLFGAKQRRDEA